LGVLKAGGAVKGAARLFFKKYLVVCIKMFYFVGMKKAKQKKRERHGRKYLGAWISSEVLDTARIKAKEDKRTLAAYVEMALSNHNDFVAK